KLIRLAVFVELFERLRECSTNFFYSPLVRENKFAAVSFPFLSRVLMNFDQQLFAISKKQKIIRFWVAVPSKQELSLKGILVRQIRKYPHQFRQSFRMRGMCGCSVKFRIAVLKSDRHPSALRAVKTDLESVYHSSNQISCKLPNH